MELKSLFETITCPMSPFSELFLSFIYVSFYLIWQPLAMTQK